MLKDKIEELFGDISDYLHWWKRKDVSLRFKILNLLSGDRLRLEIAFPAMDAKDLKDEWNWIFDPRLEINWENPSEDDIKMILSSYKHLEWRIDRIRKDLLDVFLM